MTRATPLKNFRQSLRLLVVAAGMLPLSTTAVTIYVGNASTVEGAAGTSKVLQFPVLFLDANANTTTVTGTVSAIPAGTLAATGGASCNDTPRPDFEAFSNVPFSIPPNTINGALYVGVRICGDATPEPNETFLVSLNSVSGGAVCGPETCGAMGTIQNDDAFPAVKINDISVTEPALLSRTVNFTVTLDIPSLQDVTVNYATRSGTAIGGLRADYQPRSGTLVIPANSTSASIPVTINADSLVEPSETFFVDLSSPSNATIARSTGQATILDNSGRTGGFEFSSDQSEVELGDKVAFNVTWTVPKPAVWRNLKSIDIKVGEGKPILWLRWDEPSNLLSLCEPAVGKGRIADDGTPPLQCGSSGLPGSAAILVSETAQVYLSESSVQGSGPEGQDVTLRVTAAFGPDAKAKSYPVELAASDDLGNTDRFRRAGEIELQ